MFSPHQETLIVDMVHENNAIKLSEIQQKIIEDHVNFEGINSVSLSTVDRVLKRNRLRINSYRVPFDRNSDRVKEQRFQYVQVGIYSGAKKYLVSHQLCKFSHLKR